MRRTLGDRLLMAVKEMPNGRGTVNQHELLCRRALTKGLNQPEESLDGPVQSGFRKVHDMRHVSHRALDAAAVVNSFL
jgi:hypothetical protein